MSDIVLNTKQAAEYLSLSVQTLAHWRASNEGPKFYKPGGKNVFYYKRDLDQWIKREREGKST